VAGSRLAWLGRAAGGAPGNLEDRGPALEGFRIRPVAADRDAEPLDGDAALDLPRRAARLPGVHARRVRDAARGHDELEVAGRFAASREKELDAFVFVDGAVRRAHRDPERRGRGDARRQAERLGVPRERDAGRGGQALALQPDELVSPGATERL